MPRIGRVVPLVAAGAAAAWYVRSERRAEEASAREALEHHLRAVERLSDASDVTSVIEDLLALPPRELAGAGRRRIR
jgi:hypothetical protein